MHNLRNNGCRPIDFKDHQHIFEFLSYVLYMFQLKKYVHPDDHFPESTFEDVVLICTGILVIAGIYLSMWQTAEYTDGHIFQRRHGTDDQ